LVQSTNPFGSDELFFVGEGSEHLEAESSGEGVLEIIVLEIYLLGLG
jgi:hypothetical protein